jgi:hypothetical protein
VRVLRRIAQLADEILEDIRGFLSGNGGLLSTVVSGPTDVTNCGSAEYRVRWGLRDMTRSGWIIQRVRFESNPTDCLGNPRPPRFPDVEYWEAWEVAGGKVWVGAASRGIEHTADVYRTVNEGENTRGTTAIRGKVRFVENFNLTTPPWGFAVPQARALPTLTPPAEPDGWSDEGTDDHDLVVRWVCCDGTQAQTATTLLGPNLIQRILDVVRQFLGRARKGGEGPPAMPVEFTPMVNEAIDFLDTTPAWSDIGRDDTERRRDVIVRLLRLSDNDTSVLRDVVSGYVQRKTASPTGYDVAAMSRLYVLNRVLFNVPSTVPLATPGFASFAGIPSADGVVNELWPLSQDRFGNLELTGQFAGYFGESYLAVQEFDYFAATFGRRQAGALA